MELLALAIAPAAILLFWVYHKDRYEREPMGLIFRIMAFGAIACIPAAILETLLEPFLMPDGEADPSGLVGLFVYTLLGVGLVEEGCKFYALKRNSWRSLHFNQRFDGIVYAVSASLGFAVLENILYVTTGGFSVGILRALTAVPMHCAFGVLMGVQYGRSRFEGVPNAPLRFWKAILIPTILHGLYDFFAMASSVSAWFLAGLAVVLLGSVVWAAIVVVREARNPY